jgi:hypothetical protein
MCLRCGTAGVRSSHLRRVHVTLFATDGLMPIGIRWAGLTESRNDVIPPPPAPRGA